MLEDKLLIWKFKRGSQDALRRIYEKYKNGLLKLALVLCGDTATAEDVVQDVFVSFAQSAEKVRIDGNLKSFLSTCVVNRIRSLNRNRKRHETLIADNFDFAASEFNRPEQWIILSEQLQLLTRAMAQLPIEQREVVALYMQADMSFRRIAEMQNLSINTVQGRFRYGLNKLRTLLNSEVTNETDR